MPTFAEHQQQEALLQQLRASGGPAQQAQAEQLQQLYHDQELAQLATVDVYDAAKGEGQPPSGWLRASEHLDKLREAAPGLNHLSDNDLLKLLKPDDSGFRAEIYLPDPAVLGPGYKPVVAFKGSTGEVLLSDGSRRETTREDFIANNFPQSIGMKTDYYDRGMMLATVLDKAGFDFILSGHSLAGGIASAASAVTGRPTITWNAAGLHPETALRFAREHPDVRIRDVNQTITAYMVQGEVLNDGIQNNVAGMDVIRRNQLAGVFKETSDLLKVLPEARGLLEQQLDGKDGVPESQRETVRAFIDELASGDTRQRLRELPLAAGQMQPILAAKTRLNPNDLNSPLVDREQVLSLQEVAVIATPVVNALNLAGKSAHLGHRVGEAVAVGGHMAGRVMDDTGDTVRDATQVGGDVARSVSRTAGAVTAAGAQQAGDMAARMRETAAELEARLDQAQGRAQRDVTAASAGVMRGLRNVLPDGAGRWLDEKADDLQRSGEGAYRRNQAEAAQARREGHADATAIRDTAQALGSVATQVTARAGDFQHSTIAGAGQFMDAGLDAVGRETAAVTAQAPAIGARAAGTAALQAQTNPFNPVNFPTLASAAAAFKLGGDAGHEAAARHGGGTVLSSLQHRIDTLEREARQGLAHPAPSLTPEVREPTTQPQAQTAPPPVPEHLRDFRHPDHPLHYRYTQTLTAVHALEDQRGMPHGRNSEQLAAALLAKLDTTPLAGEKDGRAHFGPVGTVELRGQGAATEAVVVERRDYYHLPARQLGVPVDQALQPVEHTAAAWSRQKMPHLYVPAEASLAQTTRPVPEQLPAYDPRHPGHAGHRGYQQLRGQVADTYAKAGMALSEDQLERATAAVSLSNRQKALPQADLLVLLPDRASGTYGPDSPLVAQYGGGNATVPLRSETTAQQMQRPAEATYQQLQQVDQQLALEQRQREQQREQAQAYGSSMSMA